MKRSPLKRKTPLVTARPMGNGETRVCAAVGCEQEFYAPPIAIRLGQGKFCSRSCAYRSRRPQTEAERARTRAIMRSHDRTGERNPNFRHGQRLGENLRGWNPPAKGETCCRVCGSTGKLNLHHAVPRSICPLAAKRDLRNGLPLCIRCHRQWHVGKLVISRRVFTAEEWGYISALELTGRDITGWLEKHYPDVPLEVAA